MVDSFPVALIAGTVLGFLSGLGIGGGSLLMLWLTLILEMEHLEARLLNLLFFIPAAVISVLFRWRSGKLPFRKIFPAIVSGCVAAALFSLLGQQLDTGILKKVFGGLLLLTGLREVFYRPKQHS